MTTRYSPKGWLVTGFAAEGSPIVRHREHGELDLSPWLFSAQDLRVGDEIYWPDMEHVLLDRGL